MQQNINVANRCFKNATYFFIFLGVLVLISISTLGVGIVAASSPAVSISQASQSVDTGDTFTIDIAVDPAENGVSSGSVKVSFDANAMQADSVTNGNLLGTSPIVPSGYPKIDNTNGTVQVELTRFGATPVPTPKGTWAAITFTAKTGATPGTYNVNLTLVSLADENFNDISGITITNGTVTIVGVPIVSISPASQYASAGDTFTVDVTVDPKAKGISRGEVNIAFNATAMQASGIAAGGLLGIGPSVSVNNIDNTTGTIQYVLTRTGTTTPPTPSGTFATITFTVKSGTPDATYNIKLTKVGLADESAADIPGIKAFNGTVKVGEPTVSIYPASQTVSAGDTFTVNVTVDPAGRGVSNGSISISFNASTMQVDSAVAGDLLGTSPTAAPGYPKIDNTTGTVQVDLTRVGTTPVPTPEGTFATITFTVKSGTPNAIYNIKLTKVGLADETAADITGIKVTNGTVRVGGPTVSIDPAAQTVSVGDTFTVDVEVDPASNGVSAGSVKISFNASAMQADSAVVGDLLGASPMVAPGYPKIDNTNGTVETDLSRVGTTPVPTAAGTWVTITFTAKNGTPDGTYNINITKAELLDESVINVITGITPTNGTVTLKTSVYPRWDINEDGEVDFKDLAILGAHYGETTTSPYPRYDINEDGEVDFKDLAILGAHYGETTSA